MYKRIVLLLLSKFKSIFKKSIAITARVEFSDVDRRARIWRNAKIFHSSIGAYSYIGPNTCLIYVHCGKFCSIAGDCAIGMGTHSLNNISTSSIFTAKKNGTGQEWAHEDAFEEYKTINIGNDVWIGQRAMVMGGVTIGNGAVVGAGAIVTKDVPPYAIVGGVPAKIIRYRFPENVILSLQKSEWWNLEESVLKENIHLFQNPQNEDNLNKLITLCKK